MRTSSVFSRRAARAIAAAVIVCVGLSPGRASAGFLDFLLGGSHSRPTRSSTARVSASTAADRIDGARSTGYCVRKCDGRYFPVQAHGSASVAQMCQAFCPATPTQVYFGNNIDGAISAGGERYADSRNAFAYRKALKADCTCNGRDPAGLAPVDLSFDTTLRPGDVVATSDGLMAYSINRTGNDRGANFTPIADYPGLTPNIRAKLDEIRVAPAGAEMAEIEIPPSGFGSTTAKRADLN